MRELVNRKVTDVLDLVAVVTVVSLAQVQQRLGTLAVSAILIKLGVHQLQK